MYFLLVLALIATFIYCHLMITDTINARLNPYGTEKDNETALLIAKVKYGLLLIMAFSWGAVIRFW